MKYSFNGDRSKLVFGKLSDVNASYKDLSAVCSAIRYKTYYEAMSVLDSIADGKPIPYRKYNKGMGARHELGGKKGRTPKKCGKIITKVLSNAVNNAKNKGYSEDELYVVHASANKIFSGFRRPPKGRQHGSGYGRYGFNTMAHSDLEFSKVEIGVSTEYEGIGLSKSSVKMIGRNKARAGRASTQTEVKHAKKPPKQKKHPLPKGSVKPKEAEDTSTETKDANAQKASASKPSPSVKSEANKPAADKAEPVKK